MLQAEFIKMYCKNSKVSEEELFDLGLIAVPCNCNEDECRGWAMISKKNIKDHIELYT